MAEYEELNLPLPPAGTSTTPPAAASQGPQPAAASEVALPRARLPEDFLRLTVPLTAAGPQASATMMGPAPTDFYGAQPQLRGPRPKQGNLMVTCIQARLAKNYGFMKMDPFCRIIIGPHVANSKVCSSGGKEPRWNQRVVVPLLPGFQSMRIEVLDMGTFGDRLVAWGDIELGRVIGGNPSEEWYPLDGKQGGGKEGVIHLHIDFQETLQNAGPNPYTYGVPVQAPFGYGYAQPQVIAAPGVYMQAPAPIMPPPQQLQQPPQPPPVQLSEADVQQVRSMFPDLDAEVIHSVLAANHGNKEAAINGLLSMG